MSKFKRRGKISSKRNIVSLSTCIIFLSLTRCRQVRQGWSTKDEGLPSMKVEKIDLVNEKWRYRDLQYKYNDGELKNQIRSI